ncbi:MAG TPA: outer membrane protein assembly factor BamE [Pseudomonadales bacterium]|nr:outer membrane protein assembly factor BamE [Pseudomonadales bacterium]
MLRQIKIVLICVSTLLLTSCGLLPKPYKIDIAQGNKFDQTQVAQLKTGMTQAQVKYVLGTPMIQDVFHPDRWDYVYSVKPGKGTPEQKRLTLYFKEGVLARVEQH